MTSKPRWVLVVVAALSLTLCVRGDSRPSEPAKAAKKSVDAQGDPLPEGVLLRLGTTRLRHAGRISGLAFSPDGQSLASASGNNRFDENVVRLWSLADGKLLMEGASGEEAVVEFVPDGKTLVSAGQHEGVYLWNVATGRRIKNLPAPALGAATRPTGIRVSPDGKSLSLVDHEGNVFLRDLSGDKKERSFRVERDNWFRLGLSADGSLVTACGGNFEVSIWEVATGKQLLKLPKHKDHVYSAVFSPDGRYLATGGRSNQVHLWELATGQLIYTLPSQDSVFAFAPDGRTLATCEDFHRGDVHLWDVPTGKERRVFPHPHGASCLAFSRDGRLLATGDVEGVIRVWEHAAGRELFANLQDGGVPAAFLEEGRVLAVNASSGLIFHDLLAPTENSGAWSARERFRLNGVHGVVSADGKTAVSPGAGYRDGVVVWDVTRKVERHKLGGRDVGGYEAGFAVSADGQQVAVGGWNGVEIFSAATGKSLHKLEGHKGSRGVGAAFSPDGKTLATAGSERDNSLHFWNALTGESIRKTALSSDREYDSYPPTLGFSPSGKVLAIGGRYRALQLWDAVQGIKAASLEQSGAFAFSPDGRLLATAGDSGKVKLWEAATGKLITELRGHAGVVVEIRFAPKGQILATGGSDHTTLLWDVRVPRLFASAGKPGKLDADERQQAWNDLGGQDAHAAYQALARLAADPAASAGFVGERLQPVRAPETEQVAKWVKDLDDDSFAVRDRATAELRRQGRLVEPALRQAVEAKPSLEVLRRIERLLAELGNEEIGLTGERLRTHRAVHLLEIVGTPEARRVLERLATGAEGAAETQMARAALLRLPK
jgi:WD40 repeat protein